MATSCGATFLLVSKAPSSNTIFKESGSEEEVEETNWTLQRKKALWLPGLGVGSRGQHGQRGRGSGAWGGAPVRTSLPADIITERHLLYLTLNFLIMGWLQGSNKKLGVKVV